MKFTNAAIAALIGIMMLAVPFAIADDSDGSTFVDKSFGASYVSNTLTYEEFKTLQLDNILYSNIMICCGFYDVGADVDFEGSKNFVVRMADGSRVNTEGEHYTTWSDCFEAEICMKATILPSGYGTKVVNHSKVDEATYEKLDSYLGEFSEGSVLTLEGKIVISWSKVMTNTFAPLDEKVAVITGMEMAYKNYAFLDLKGNLDGKEFSVYKNDPSNSLRKVTIHLESLEGLTSGSPCTYDLIDTCTDNVCGYIINGKTIQSRTHVDPVEICDRPGYLSSSDFQPISYINAEVYDPLTPEELRDYFILPENFEDLGKAGYTLADAEAVYNSLPDGIERGISPAGMFGIFLGILIAGLVTAVICRNRY